MIQSIYTSLAGMLSHRTRMDVLANNIANINTPGYKAAQASFQDTLYQTIRTGTAQSNPSQVGTGVTLAAVLNNFNQGSLVPTGRSLDLAINGNGFFGVLKETDAGEELYYTREGSFYMDKDGYLVNSNGLRLVNDSGSAIQLQPESGKSISSISVTQLGEVVITYGDGTTSSDKPRIGLFDFPNPNGLTKIGNNLYSDNNAAQAGAADNPAGTRIDGKPGENGLGTIESGCLEMSNVDLATELGNLIVTQRGYEANAKVFTTSDEVLRETIELKR
ncbi:flagellar hook-basal body protein [Desulfofundulus thermosubterraneus]|uniref:Flagellar hook protein FlgE n=1 Tax=Desulfofundulus thermosubterraneus DSM 16057 TaxID=1121432 RepID=A0A1M6FWZ1_9FIRM|nr:flagellar hook-basal body protein [Desulfofundulus thermosubterraneus]SHJ02140.1 flagellar hook protein FlgE [Desulfofundulus thermosubterraneus DSM 16057]